MLFIFQYKNSHTHAPPSPPHTHHTLNISVQLVSIQKNVTYCQLMAYIVWLQVGMYKTREDSTVPSISLIYIFCIYSSNVHINVWRETEHFCNVKLYNSGKYKFIQEFPAEKNYAPFLSLLWLHKQGHGHMINNIGVKWLVFLTRTCQIF